MLVYTSEYIYDDFFYFLRFIEFGVQINAKVNGITV